MVRPMGLAGGRKSNNCAAHVADGSQGDISDAIVSVTSRRYVKHLALIELALGPACYARPRQLLPCFAVRASRSLGACAAQ
jgi:hypothetical protein